MDNVSAVAGDHLVLHCPVAGHPIETVYWEKGIQRTVLVVKLLRVTWILNKNRFSL